MVKRTVNTYAWIMATASSRIVKINMPGIAIINLGLSNNMKFPKRLISKCPATMLAVKRTDNVIGRIILLISSINAIKFIRGVGVPVGTM